MLQFIFDLIQNSGLAMQCHIGEMKKDRKEWRNQGGNGFMAKLTVCISVSQIDIVC